MTRNFEDQIAQLLAALELNINCCEILMNNFQSYKNDPLRYTQFINNFIGQYLIMICNHHFFDCVSILTTLLYSKDEREISFVKIKTTIESQALLKFETISKEFKDKGFLKLRHNVGDHKNEEVLINPILINIIPISVESYESLKKISDDLISWAHNNFDLTSFANIHTAPRGLQSILDKTSE